MREADRLRSYTDKLLKDNIIGRMVRRKVLSFCESPVDKERKGKFEDNYFGDCGSVTGSRFTGVEEDGLFDGGCGIDNRRGSY